MEKQEHNTGESITGGVVYRGNAHPSLRGVYLFGDFVSRRVWADRNGDGLQQRSQLLGRARYAGPTAFALTKSDRVLAVTYDGTMWRLRNP